MKTAQRHWTSECNYAITTLSPITDLNKSKQSRATRILYFGEKSPLESAPPQKKSQTTNNPQNMETMNTSYDAQQTKEKIHPQKNMSRIHQKMWNIAPTKVYQIISPLNEFAIGNSDSDAKHEIILLVFNLKF